MDGAHFNKSAEGVFWAILGMVSNLPFTIRARSQNILKTLFINAKMIDFNKIIDKHLGQLKTLLSDGLWLETLKLNITVFIHVLIADAPARVKICNMKQFNGEFGCLHCLNTGKSTQRRCVYLGTNQETLSHSVILV